MLTTFLFRLAFGLAAAALVTPWRHVTSGYFRIQLLIVMALCTLATLVAFGAAHPPLWLPLIAAVLGFVGSTLWLLDRPRAATGVVLLVAAVTLTGTIWTADVPSAAPLAARLLGWLTPPCSGLLLGSSLAAMLLGHWYLNTPTMQILPLRRLVALTIVVVLLRMVLGGTALLLHVTTSGPPDLSLALLMAFRWLTGLIGVLLLATMTWQTLKIPNTQSATGILYVAVTGTFAGELTAQLLSAETLYPL